MSIVSDVVCVDAARRLQLTVCVQAWTDAGTAEAILVFKQFRTMSRKKPINFAQAAKHLTSVGDGRSDLSRDNEYSQRFSVVLFIPSIRKTNTLKRPMAGSYHSLDIQQFDSKRTEILTVSLNESQPNTILRSGGTNPDAGTRLEMDRWTGTI